VNSFQNPQSTFGLCLQITNIALAFPPPWGPIATKSISELGPCSPNSMEPVMPNSCQGKPPSLCRIVANLHDSWILHFATDSGPSGWLVKNTLSHPIPGLHSRIAEHSPGRTRCQKLKGRDRSPSYESVCHWPRRLTLRTLGT